MKITNKQGFPDKIVNFTRQVLCGQKKLRLITTLTCGRKCEGCCNKQFDMDRLPVADNYSDYSMVILTGGEPMLFPSQLRCLVSDIKAQTDAPVVVYASKIVDLRILSLIDGLTFTCHTFSDWHTACTINNIIRVHGIKLSLHLNIFTESGITDAHLLSFKDWIIKKDIEWIPGCPLPQDEVLMRLKYLW
jgi:hypothetical protein